MPAASAVIRSPRASRPKSVRRCRSRTVSWWAWSAFHDERAVRGSASVGVIVVPPPAARTPAGSRGSFAIVPLYGVWLNLGDPESWRCSRSSDREGPSGTWRPGDATEGSGGGRTREREPGRQRDRGAAGAARGGVGTAVRAELGVLGSPRSAVRQRRGQE